jgi:hypothetical protein
MEDEDRSIEELQDEIVWEDGIATLPDEEDDSEYVDRRYGREY